jgi:Lrp/AsnC family transcriptional regulator, leucine-responsive regulatory protein
MQKDAPNALDEFDLQILSRYQHDTRRTAEDIGAEVGLSAAAVQRRLKRLRETGVIEAETARISPKAAGFPLTCIVSVDIEREGASELSRFKARMLACAEVQQCFYVTGAADFVLVVLASDMAAYEAFTREQLLSDANVRSFTSYVVMEPVKTGVTVPLPRPEQQP